MRNVSRWIPIGVVLSITVAVVIGAGMLMSDIQSARQRADNYKPVPMTPSPSSSPQIRLVVLGDSIAGGSKEGGNGANGWPALVAQQLGFDLVNKAQGGTGYTAGSSEPTSAPYRARVDEIVALKPDLLIVEGSRNDTDPAKTRIAADQVLGTLRAGLPETKILVIGPIYSYPANVGTTPVNEAVKAAAVSHH